MDTFVNNADTTLNTLSRITVEVRGSLALENLQKVLSLVAVQARFPVELSCVLDELSLPQQSDWLRLFADMVKADALPVDLALTCWGETLPHKLAQGHIPEELADLLALYHGNGRPIFGRLVLDDTLTRKRLDVDPDSLRFLLNNMSELGVRPVMVSCSSSNYHTLTHLPPELPVELLAQQQDVEGYPIFYGLGNFFSYTLSSRLTLEYLPKRLQSMQQAAGARAFGIYIVSDMQEGVLERVENLLKHIGES